MGNSPTKQMYDLVGGTSCALERGDGPPSVPKPSGCAIIAARVEEVCCCLKAEEIRKRHFDAHDLPILSEGEVFVIKASRESDHASTLGQARSMITRFFRSDASEGNRSSLNETVVGSPCMVTVNLDFILRWKSLELSNNESKFRGMLPLHKVHRVQPVSGGRNQSLELVDEQSEALLQLQADNSLIRDHWVDALSKFLAIYGAQIESAMKSELHKSAKETRMQKKRQDIEQRRLAAKAKISKLGLNGMKHSAQARISSTR